MSSDYAVAEARQWLVISGDLNHFSGPAARFSRSEPDLPPSDSLVRNELIIGFGLMERETYTFPTILTSNPEHFSE
jgi:hypothetical protein